jgi:hypothetical protein
VVIEDLEDIDVSFDWFQKNSKVNTQKADGLHSKKPRNRNRVLGEMSTP